MKKFFGYLSVIGYVLSFALWALYDVILETISEWFRKPKETRNDASDSNAETGDVLGQNQRN